MQAGANLQNNGLVGQSTKGLCVRKIGKTDDKLRQEISLNQNFISTRVIYNYGEESVDIAFITQQSSLWTHHLKDRAKINFV